MSLRTAREALTRLIDEEIGTLLELSQLLELEHSIVATKQPVEVLDEACNRRQVRMGALLRLQEERRDVLRALNLADTPSALDSLLNQFPDGGALRRRWKQALDLATRCRDLNERNGALVTARLKRVEGMLEVMTGEATGPKVYGPRGSVNDTRAGRMLAAEA